MKSQLDEICELVDAAGGRTLGLFSSRRAAEAAAEVVRERLPHLTTLAQGDAQLPELAKQFVEDPHTCLFGTLSLWQGLDVPGETCQLVLIDRIPFPRPDDPLMSARQKAADRAGGNGFMQVAATHAALLLAQGAGRLIRTTTDRGVVAVLDPRLATARYGSFLKASLPPMWTTTDPALVAQGARRGSPRADLAAGRRASTPARPGAQPTTTSRIQWLPVPTTTSAVTSGVAPGQPRGSSAAVVAAVTASATHSAQPACMLGKAASWLVIQPMPWGADAASPHQPRRRAGPAGR